MTSARPWWAIVGVLVVLTLGLGLGCGGNGVDEKATCTLPPSVATTTLDVTTTLDAATTLQVTTTVAETTTVPADVDISGQLVGVWDCLEMPGDWMFEFRADGTGECCQQGEIGDIFTEFSYQTEGSLVTLYYSDDMWQELELSADGSVLAEAGQYGEFSFRKQ